MSFHQLRAIAVFERDLAREERKIEESKMAALLTETQSNSISLSPSSNLVDLPSTPTQPGAESVPSSQIPTGESPPASHPSASIPPARRPSIFLSSLQRPMPLKLDLSALSHRMTTEEGSLFSGGLASPVTLAPKSARPTAAHELPPDLMAFASGSSDADAVGGPIDIDLTVPDETRGAATIDATADGMVGVMLDATLGNSADKPIEVDLDLDIEMTMTDIFGDAEPVANGTTVDDLFAPSTTSPDIALGGTGVDGKSMKSDVIDMGLFGSLSVDRQTDAGQDLFSSFGADSQQSLSADQLSGPSTATVGMSSSMPSGPSTSGIAPSPASLLASFEAASNMNASEGLSSTGVDNPFDFDLSTLSPSMFSTTPSQGLNFEELFNMDGGQNALDSAMGIGDGGQQSGH